MILFIVLIVLGLYLDFSEEGQLKEGNRIKRLEPGEEDEEIHLNLSAENVLDNYDYTLTLGERIPDEEERRQLLKQAEKEIDQDFCREGEELSHVTESVNIRESYVNGLVQASWTFDEDQVVDVNGVIQEDEVPKEGILVKVSAELICYQSRETCEFSFKVFPKEKSRKEQIVADVRKKLTGQSSEEGETYVRLPDEVDGVKLEWSQDHPRYTVRIVILELLAIGGLFVANSERRKNERKILLERMQLDYPEIVSKLLILCGAGMSIKQAWHRIASSYERKRDLGSVKERPAYEEILLTDREMSDGISERKALQGFGERIPLGSYHRFSRLLTESLQKGSKGIDGQLRREAEDAFESRKQLARKLGEEAGTKMLAPMMIMLVIVMAIIIMPATISF